MRRKLADGKSPPPADGGGRNADGDGPAPGGTGGGWGVTSGAPLWAFAAAAGVTVAICVVNVLSAWHDRPAMRAGGQAWKVPSWEFSSGAVILLLLPLMAALARLGGAPRRGRWGRFLLVHVVGVVGYSLLHVGGFVLLRQAVYAAHGAVYRFGPAGDLLYEFRKDALSYALLTGLFGLSGSRAVAQLAPAAPSGSQAAALFDIRDGAKLIRMPVAEIVAASSAGNYVEVRLADGRSPLMRATLASVEAELAPHGFVRTHRSWIVNPAHVRGIEPAGSGDRRLSLSGGTEAPLSRRYAEALQRLRGGGEPT